MRRTILVTLMLLMALPLLATNGYFVHGVGTPSKAMAGATTALPQEALDVDTNPAGGVFLAHGYSISLALFSPDRQYTVTGAPSGYPQTFGLTPGTITSNSKYFFMPSGGINFRPNEKSAVTVNFTAHGGMNTDYRTSTFYGSDHTGVDLAQMFLTTTYGYKLTKNQSVGASAVIAVQRFQASGLEAFAPFSSDAAALTGNGHEWSQGIGVKLGYLARPLPQLAIGAAYSPTIHMSSFTKYRGLFAQNGHFNVPGSFNTGIAYTPKPELTFDADYQRIHYSDIGSVGNPLLPNLAMAPLGADNGAGFGWRDINVYKIGAQWKATEVWTWRAGYSKCDQPVPSSEVLFNILAPGVVQDHVTLGFSKAVERSGGRFNVALMYAPSKTVTGGNPLEVPGVQQIQLKMREFEIEFGYSF
jgi:long-chain fatty acid transport protein